MDTTTIFEIIEKYNITEEDQAVLREFSWGMEDLQNVIKIQNEEHLENYQKIQVSLKEGKVSDLDNVSFFAAQKAVECNQRLESIKFDIFNK